MKITLIGFCLILLLADSGCKKSGASSVSGQVVDNTTGRGVPYADVYVVGQGSGTIGAQGQNGNGSAKADGNGNFSIDFNWEKGSYYKVTAIAPFYADGAYVSYVYLSAGNNSVKIPMVPLGYVRFNIVNVPPLDTIFQFSIGDFSNAPLIQHLSKDTFFIVNGLGNKLTHFTYTINKYGFIDGFANYNDSVYIKALDTVSYTINY